MDLPQQCSRPPCSRRHLLPNICFPDRPRSSSPTAQDLLLRNRSTLWDLYITHTIPTMLRCLSDKGNQISNHFLFSRKYSRFKPVIVNYIFVIMLVQTSYWACLFFV